jgi:hypothetical protein
LEILIELRWCLETFARALQDHLKALIWLIHDTR